MSILRAYLRNFYRETSIIQYHAPIPVDAIQISKYTRSFLVEHLYITNGIIYRLRFPPFSSISIVELEQ